MLARLRYLFPYFRRYRRQLAGGLLAVVAAVAIGLLAPLLVGRAVDSLKADVSMRSLLVYAGLLLAVTAGAGVFSYLQRMLLVTMSRDIEADLRNVYFAKLEALSVGFYTRSYTGDLMARATNDLQAVRMLCGPAIMYSSTTLFTALGALSFMVAIHGPLTLVALAPMPLVAWVTHFVGQRIHVLFERVQESFSELSTKVQENLAGTRVVRAYAREDAERRQFATANDDYVGRNRDLIRWDAAFRPAIQILVGLGFIAVLWYGGALVVSGQITVGELVTFNLFLGELVWPMIAIGWVINLVQRGTASLGRIREVLEREPEVVEAPAERRFDPGPLAGAVECRRLTFSYDGVAGASAEADGAAAAPVLLDVDLAVPAGATVALVGRTGAGKSTLLSLIPRLFEPPPDSVFVDGVDVTRLPLERLRGAIGMVPQETFLFSTSVRDNIALGVPEASRDQVLEAARLAGLESDLAGFPQGLETLVGERGITLSGGQKQRVALARAILRQPRILILDDALSAVDTHTEETILTNLRRVFAGRTVFLVSHRISTVRHADLILVLEHGRIVDRGSHEELTGRHGLYADLHQRQMLEEELETV
ncbi:MAG TPA: ABC transporter ATP-binding protein [Thermoanaerobaculia bacterium]|nr:ABC transporter ATP-binding protein [Thermoanaerobaculia bacterium]